jgi:acyl-coenzyme A thioesterase PaaI-like protein
MGTLAKAYTGHDVLVTADIHVHFLKALSAGDKAVIKGRITHAGSRLMNLVSELYKGDELCATANAIFYKVGEK